MEWLYETQDMSPIKMLIYQLCTKQKKGQIDI